MVVCFDWFLLSCNLVVCWLMFVEFFWVFELVEYVWSGW